MDWRAGSILFWHGEPVRAASITLDGTRRELISHPKRDIIGSQLSPDGRAVAFHTRIEGEHSQVFVARVPESRPIQVENWIPATGVGLHGTGWWVSNTGLAFFNGTGLSLIQLDPRTLRPQGTSSVLLPGPGAQVLFDGATFFRKRRRTNGLQRHRDLQQHLDARSAIGV